MSASPPVAAGGPVTIPEDRQPDLILARLHLLLGSLSLARAELETLAGRGFIDDAAIRDLAEARWRTGDLAGAGEAAAAILENHPDDILALVILAEAQAALGRPAEARRLAGRAIERAQGSLDPVFAGMQRSSIWPVEPGSAVGPVGVLFDDLHPGPHAVRPLPRTTVGTFGRLADLGATGRATAAADQDDGEAGDPMDFTAHATGDSLWGDDAAAPALDDQLDPIELFHRARGALESGQAADAATGLILALRASPGLAPAILDLLSGRNDAILALVRGDAQRIVGREVEAMRDHAAAAGRLGPADIERSDGDQPGLGLDDQVDDRLVEAETHAVGPDSINPDQEDS